MQFCSWRIHTHIHCSYHNTVQLNTHTTRQRAEESNKKLHWRAAVGAQLHTLRAVAAYALVAARHGEVRLRVGHAHDARGHAAEAGLGDGVTAGDVAHIGEGQHRLSGCRLRLRRRRLRSRRRRHCLRARGRAATPSTGTTPAAPAAPAAAYLSTAWQGCYWRGC
eukprot:scaffold30956_cov61-Phaeocystis_antarctica.AAC.1